MIDPRKVRPFDGRGLPSTEDSVLAHRLVDPPPPRSSPWGAIIGGILLVLLVAALATAVWYGHGLVVLVGVFVLFCLLAIGSSAKKG